MTMDENHPIYKAIDRGGGQTCDIAGVIRELDKAVRSLQNIGQNVSDHFQEVFPDVGKNPEGGRPARDYKLNRYACYLVTQNADARKKPVAFGQTYFAIQTRRQELTDQAEGSRGPPGSERLPHS